ncbi:hypothetical protein O988_04343 [Pseudogymnoascus sp. VKM F-3808]|nr:hypothetical protein O988_04343 [Pseudogymnoascus sp. VKM F-3808]
MGSPPLPTPIKEQQQPVSSSDESESSQLSFKFKKSLLPTRRLINFEPLRKPNPAYQHGRDSPLWGEQQPRDALESPELPQPSPHTASSFISARPLIDLEPLRLPDPSYQHGRDSPVWGQPLQPPETPESPQPLFRSVDRVPQRRPRIDFESFRIHNAAPRHGRHLPVLERWPFFEPPRELERPPSRFNVVYSNGWINQVPIRPMDYEYCMLPLQLSDHGQSSPVSRGSEPLADNGLDPLQDSGEPKRRITRDRLISIERVCKEWVDELTNGPSNLNSTYADADVKDLFASLENLELRGNVESEPSTEALPQRSVKQPPNRYTITKRIREEPLEEKVNAEDLPYWLSTPFMFGIRLPWGMVDLAQRHFPRYLAREWEDPLVFFPSELLFEERFPLANVIPKKGQIGLHPTFRTAALEDILKAEKELELAKEPQFETPQKAWRSPVIGPCSSDAEEGSSKANMRMTDDESTESPTNMFRFEHWNPERHSRSVDERSNRSISSEHIEPIPAVDEDLMFWEQDMDIHPSKDQPVSSDQTEPIPAIDDGLMFWDEDKETLSKEQPASDLTEPFPAEDEDLMFWDQDMETPSKDQPMSSDPIEPFPAFDENLMFWDENVESLSKEQSVSSDEIEPFPAFDEDLMFWDEDMGSLSKDKLSISVRESMKSPDIGPVRLFSELDDHQSMEPSNTGPVTIFSGEDIETVEGSISSDQGMEPPTLIPFPRFYNPDIERLRATEDQVEIASDQETESLIGDQESHYVGQGMEYLLKDLFQTFYYNGDTESATEDGVSINSGEGMEDPQIDPASMMHDQDIESQIDDQESVSSCDRIDPSLVLHEDIPVVKWWFMDSEDDKPAKAKPSSNQDKRARERYKRDRAAFPHLPPIDFTGTYIEFCETPFGIFINDGGLEDYAPSDKKEQKTTEPPDDLPVPTEVYGPVDHEERMQELLAEIELEGATQILTTWQEIYAERSEEEQSEDEKAETSVEDTKAKIIQEPPVPIQLEKKRPKRRSWCEELPPPARADRIERRKSLGDEIELNRKRMSWLGELAALKEEDIQEVLKDSIGQVPLVPADLLLRKKSKRASWLGGPPPDREVRIEGAFGDSQAKATPGHANVIERQRSNRSTWFGGLPIDREEQTMANLKGGHRKSIQGSLHPPERKSSKRRSFFAGLSTERVERTKEDVEFSNDKLTEPSVHPLDRKDSKRRSWFAGLSTEREERTERGLEDSHEIMTQPSVQPLKRNASKRRSLFAGLSTERVERTMSDLEYSQVEATEAPVHPMERKGSKRRSWFPSISTEKVEQPKANFEGSHEKVTEATVHPPERRASKRRSFFAALSAERVERTKYDPEDNGGKVTQVPVQPLERKASKRRSFFAPLSSERVERTKGGPEDNNRDSTQARLERKASKRRSFFAALSTDKVERTKDEPEDNHGDLTQAHIHPLERKGSKRRSWFGIQPERQEQSLDSLENSHRAVSQEPVTPLERKRLKRMSWFGGLPAARKEETAGAFENSHGIVPQVPTHPLQRSQSKRKSWFGVTPAKKDEQTRQSLETSTLLESSTLEISKRAASQKPADPQEQMRAKRSSWIGGLSIHKEKQTKKDAEDSREKIAQEQVKPSEQKHAKRASWFGGLPGEREKKERKAKRSSWFV